MMAIKAVVHVVDASRDRATLSNAIRSCCSRRTRGDTDRSGRSHAEGERTSRRTHLCPPGSSSLHRKADRAGHQLCRPGRHRHRERAAAERTAQSPFRSKRLRQRCFRSSAALRAIFSRCLRQCWRTRSASATPTSETSIAGTARSCTSCIAQYAACFRRSSQAFTASSLCRNACWSHGRDTKQRFTQPTCSNAWLH